MLRIAAEEAKKRNRRLHRPIPSAALAACTLSSCRLPSGSPDKMNADMSTQAAVFADNAAREKRREGRRRTPVVLLRRILL
jgi:hypothetical protein